MKRIIPVILLLLIAISSSNLEKRKQRAKIDQNLERFELNIDNLNRRIDLFDPVSLPLDQAMLVWEKLNKDIESLNVEFQAYYDTLYGDI
ncbi:MAG TPA: hypothetical protein PL124_11365 [Candidatus Cloacimonadota bacterium]|nr:hypothetical protein [Candidatus Cloacimonadota bacterium]